MGTLCFPTLRNSDLTLLFDLNVPDRNPTTVPSTILAFLPHPWRFGRNIFGDNVVDCADWQLASADRRITGEAMCYVRCAMGLYKTPNYAARQQGRKRFIDNGRWWQSQAGLLGENPANGILLHSAALLKLYLFIAKAQTAKHCTRQQAKQNKKLSQYCGCILRWYVMADSHWSSKLTSKGLKLQQFAFVIDPTNKALTKKLC